MREGWRTVSFADAVEDVSGGNVKTPQSEFLPRGRFAVVDQGKELIAGFVDDEARLCHAELPVIVFGDHTRCFKYVDFPFCIGADGVKVLRPAPGTDAKYLYRYLRQLRLTEGGYDRHFKYLKRSPVLLPPVSEQRRIAEVLDRAEALRAKRRMALSRMEVLAQAMFLDLFGDPTRETGLFRMATLGDLGEWQSGGTPPRSDSGYFEGEIAWFSSGELGEMTLSTSAECISSRAIAESSAKRVPQGSLMLGMYDTAALKASIAGVNASCNQAVAFGTLCTDLANAIYVYFAIVIGREHFRRLQRGVRQKNLNLTMVREIRIPLPPLPLQQEFAHRVAAVDELKAAQRASLAQLDALFASLQHRAFRGEL